MCSKSERESLPYAEGALHDSTCSSWLINHYAERTKGRRRAFFCIKKGRRRPTLAWAGPTLPSAMKPLTSVFGMGTGITASLWPPARRLFGSGTSWSLKGIATLR